MGEWLVSTEGRRQCLLIGKKTKGMSYSSDRTLIQHKNLQRKTLKNSYASLGGSITKLLTKWLRSDVAAASP